MYWFFGKPKLPSLLIYGADLSLDQQNRFQHGLRAYGFSADLKITSNEDISLFDNGGADMHYKIKKIFGGEEVVDTIKLELKGLGAAFLVLEAAFPSLPLAGKLRLSLGLQKAFVIPWGYEKFSGGRYVETHSMLMTALLSGLSIHGSLSW